MVRTHIDENLTGSELASVNPRDGLGKRVSLNVVNNSITTLAGVRVGHWTDLEARTGCTVILMPPGGATASAEIRGGAPGTRETALLEVTKSVQVVHALCFAGGSAFGLDAATGVMRYVEEIGEGVETRVARVPIVPSAVIYDLAVGSAQVRPTAMHGYDAARAATTQPVSRGAVGVGAGAMVGKALGFARAQRGGLGNAALRVGAATVAALVVANPFGDVVNESGAVVAGARRMDGSRLTDEDWVELLTDEQEFEYLKAANTTLIAVGTNASLNKLECRLLAEAAQVGLARGTRPSHTPFDGDSAFGFSVGGVPKPPLPALIAATQRVAHLALLDAVQGEGSG
jgi:L-aminopeptidase/D-esterase-like protein